MLIGVGISILINVNSQVSNLFRHDKINVRGFGVSSFWCEAIS